VWIAVLRIGEDIIPHPYLPLILRLMACQEPTRLLIECKERNYKLRAKDVEERDRYLQYISLKHRMAYLHSLVLYLITSLVGHADGVEDCASGGNTFC